MNNKTKQKINQLGIVLVFYGEFRQ